MLGPLFPLVHNHLICLDHVEGKVVVLAPPGQVSNRRLIGYLVVVGDQATVVSSGNLMVVSLT